jgi:hypothetical protein
MWICVKSWFKNLLLTSQATVAQSCSVGKLVSNYLSLEFEKYLDQVDSDEFTLFNTSTKLGKLLLIYLDTGCLEIYQKPVQMIKEKLLNCNKYIYMNAERVEKCLYIFDAMVNCLKSKLI